MHVQNNPTRIIHRDPRLDSRRHARACVTSTSATRKGITALAGKINKAASYVHTDKDHRDNRPRGVEQQSSPTENAHVSSDKYRVPLSKFLIKNQLGGSRSE